MGFGSPSNSFIPANHAYDLVDALGGTVVVGGSGQIIIKIPFDVFGGAIFYHMTIYGSMTLALAGAAETFDETFYAVPDVKVSSSVYGDVAHTPPTTTGFTGYHSAGFMAGYWIASGIFVA